MMMMMTITIIHHNSVLRVCAYHTHTNSVGLLEMFQDDTLYKLTYLLIGVHVQCPMTILRLRYQLELVHVNATIKL